MQRWHYSKFNETGVGKVDNGGNVCRGANTLKYDNMMEKKIGKKVKSDSDNCWYGTHFQVTLVECKNYFFPLGLFLSGNYEEVRGSFYFIIKEKAQGSNLTGRV